MRRSGMTVIELLVGLTVAGLAVAAGSVALSALVDQRARLRETSAAATRAAAIRRAVVTWIDGAYIAAEQQAPPFQLVDHTARGREDDELTFLTSAPTPLGTDNVVVRLFVDRDDRTLERGLVAEFVERFGARTRRVELDSSVVALDIRCLSEMLGKREWMRTWLSASVLPQGVELRLAAVPPERLSPLLRFPLTVALVGGR